MSAYGLETPNSTPPPEVTWSAAHADGPCRAPTPGPCHDCDNGSGGRLPNSATSNVNSHHVTTWNRERLVKCVFG